MGEGIDTEPPFALLGSGGEEPESRCLKKSGVGIYAIIEPNLDRHHLEANPSAGGVSRN
jgi:hypothetical protein